ncbi:MAG: fumarylacetoacetase [Steroidobacteraceae bacterium]
MTAAAATDRTHDATLRSWVESANGHPDFPVQNLPLAIVVPHGGSSPRGGIAIGDRILDLQVALSDGLLYGLAADAARAASGPTLNPLLALGAAPRRALREQVSALLQVHGEQASHARNLGERLLPLAQSCTLLLPAMIGDYTDFYAGIHHAVNVGRLFRPDNPLLPNYKHVPIGYHGRASSIRVSGTPLKRPWGQTKPPDAERPSFGPSKRLDIELEIGIWVGPGNALGAAVPIGEAQEHVAGFCLLNDWSARDIQAWEYQPLGPFLAKNFMSTVSPWIITPEALAPFRIAQAPRPEGDPRPLPYLWDEADQRAGAFNIDLEVLFSSAKMRAQGMPPARISASNMRHLYWTAAQMLTHHASNGCNLQPGDLLGTGTISGPTRDSMGSLLEATEGGKIPLVLPTAEKRTFLEDGDEVILRARASREGFASIGFGECRGLVIP